MEQKIMNLFLAIIIMFASGCGLFRKTHQSKEQWKSAAKQEIKTAAAMLTTDQSVITIKEKIDTTILILEKTILQDTELHMDSLINGMTAIKNDLLEVSLVLNPVTGILSAKAVLKPHKVTVRMERETIKYNDIKRNEQQSSAIVNDSKSSGLHSITDRRPAKNIWLTVLIIIIIVLIFWWVSMRNR